MDEQSNNVHTLRQRIGSQQSSSTSNPSPSCSTSPIIPSTSTKDNLNVDAKDDIQIKLKFLDENIKIVRGSKSELIGDFKKRNFSVEIENDKLVKLVFNGQVLMDTQNISNSGLFDDCVVHCLIHNKRTVTVPGENATPAANTGILPENGTFFVYFGIFLVLATLIFCWFCRIQYSNLFSFYSTIGLVLMSGLFLVMLPLIILIEREVFW